MEFVYVLCRATQQGMMVNCQRSDGHLLSDADVRSVYIGEDLSRHCTFSNNQLLNVFHTA